MDTKPQELKVKISFNHGESDVSSTHQDAANQPSESLKSFALSERDELDSSKVDAVEAPTKAEYEYHYGRIVAAAGFLIVFFLVIAWGGVRYMSGQRVSESESLAAMSTKKVAEQVVVEKASNKDNQLEPQSGENNKELHLLEEDNLAEEPFTNTTVAVEESSFENSQSENELAAISSDNVPSTDNNQVSTANQVELDVEIAPQPSASQSEPVVVTVYDQALIGRAKLSLELIDKDPVGDVYSPVQLGEKSIVRLFFSTTLNKAFGERFFHVWYLEGKEIARVPLNVTSSSWRGNSGKYINRASLGNWQVRLEDLDGKALAETSFEAVP